ncbi:hypothetical protein SD10_08150 [Spirosoma radiotolerans]|uniref:Uncharacterized protein n=1 Tax=Spirosoma radiotolerans TaxID=1379870 RepID=A0A0E3V6W0_9BACT|nr:hypothetical protein SD10_08150 [Spirosoma radiotolerans]
MFVYLTSITTQGELRSFSFRSPSLELAFMVLNAIKKEGDELLSIQVVDGPRAILLPPEAFDGQDFSQPLTELEGQWKQLLSSQSSD